MEGTHKPDTEQQDYTTPCPDCKEGLPKDAKACPNCGRPLNIPKQEASSELHRPGQQPSALFWGILIFPYLFAWLTLRKGYSTRVRVLSIAWACLFIVPGIINIFTKEAPPPLNPPSTYSSAPTTTSNQTVTANISAAQAEANRNKALDIFRLHKIKEGEYRGETMSKYWGNYLREYEEARLSSIEQKYPLKVYFISQQSSSSADWVNVFAVEDMQGAQAHLWPFKVNIVTAVVTPLSSCEFSSNTEQKYSSGVCDNSVGLF